MKTDRAFVLVRGILYPIGHEPRPEDELEQVSVEDLRQLMVDVAAAPPALRPFIHHPRCLDVGPWHHHCVVPTHRT